jgi:hypothetical protein
MEICQFKNFFCIFVLTLAMIGSIPVVAALEDSVTIAYRGAGGNYIGDVVVFDGRNTAGNTTIIRLSGPDLPAEGVPLYNLNGESGSGTPVVVNPDGTWKLVWYSENIVGIEKMQTARYIFTACDKDNPHLCGTTSVLMKKPVFFITVTPGEARYDDYVLLVGNAEKGISYAQIDVKDSTGSSLHTFIAPVSSSGYFSYGFHVDMVPGTYSIVVSNPSMANPLEKTLVIISPQSVNATTPVITSTTGTSNPISPDAGSITINAIPDGSMVYLDSVMAGTSPVTLDNISPGSHHVEIKSPGYITSSVDLNVETGKSTTLSPELLKSTSASPLSPVTIGAGLLIAVFIMLARIRDRRKK